MAKDTHPVLTPPQDLLRLCFELRDGALYWRERPVGLFPSARVARATNTQFAGRRAGVVVRTGHVRITISGYGTFMAHRLVWKLVHGEDVPTDIQHLDHNPTNNAVGNLEPVSRAEHLRNQPLRRGNKYGAAGITKHHRCYIARIKVGPKHLYLGLFRTVEEAVAARRAAERQHGYHPNTGLRV